MRKITWVTLFVLTVVATLLVTKQFRRDSRDFRIKNVEAIRIWKQHTGDWKSGNIEIKVGVRKDDFFYLDANGEFPIVSDDSAIIYIDSSSGNVQTKTHTITLLPRTDHIIVEIYELPLPSKGKYLFFQRPGNS